MSLQQESNHSAEEINALHSLPDDALATPQEAAAFLRVQYTTLAWYRCTGYGPNFVRIGPKLIRYRMGDLRAYAKGQQMSEGMRRTSDAMLVARKKVEEAK